MSDPNIAARAQLYGPATCGCVAVMKTWDVEHLTFVQQAKYGKLRGWARCPHCKGEGVDPRIMDTRGAVNDTLHAGAVACP